MNPVPPMNYSPRSASQRWDISARETVIGPLNFSACLTCVPEILRFLDHILLLAESDRLRSRPSTSTDWRPNA